MKWIKIKYHLFVATIYVLIIATIFTCAWFNNKFLETIGLFSSFLVLRYAFPSTFHCKKFLNCIITTIIVFITIIPHILPLSVSIFSSIFFGGLIGLGLCKFEEMQIKKEKEFAQKTIFDLTNEELLELINITNLTEEEKMAVKLRLINHLKGQQWYNAMGYSKRNCQYLYKHAVDKLNHQLYLHLYCTKSS